MLLVQNEKIHWTEPFRYRFEYFDEKLKIRMHFTTDNIARSTYLNSPDNLNQTVIGVL